MELKSSRWASVKFVLLAGLVIAVIVANGVPGEFAVPLGLTVAIVPAAFAWFVWPQRVIARIDADSLHLGDKSGRLADLLSVETRISRALLIPVSRTIVFKFRAREFDSWMVRAAGARKLGLSVGRIAGGRKAAGSFADAVLAARDALPARPRHDPVPAPSDSGRATPGFDADAIIARYLIERAQSAPAAPPARGFGRRGFPTTS